MKPNRRHVLMAATAAAVATVATGEASTAQTAAATDPYGSGALGDWTVLSHSVATEATITYVRDNDGVYMFGDSISVQDGKALASQLIARTGKTIAVHNWSGRPTGPAVDALQNWAVRYGMPRRILMATGTNDIFNPPVFAAQVDRTMRIVGSRREVVWVNVQCARTAKSAAVQLADQRNSAWINSQLLDAEKKYPNLTVVRWAESLAAAPSHLTTYLREGVHTSVPAGQTARNDLILKTLMKV
ncbi:hypothetical protein [Kribbella solani]|uniref:SGNH hydrolase-type esterase domain-containing protein n=1 Tax=Kribbella solani TaxID=236067 RepID=A0A841DF40_9ACTN|nr:hypothetical protein [Kribbella solani]MBB5977714.1 hypothetical protein [Kribbella solani]